MRLPLVALALTLAACGDASPSCTQPLAAGRLYEGYCDGATGFCFHDHETPF